jgi:hypothetical protein
VCRRDVYVVYADKDLEIVYRRLEPCLREHGINRPLMGYEPHENTHSYMADNIVSNIDRSWKVGG